MEIKIDHHIYGKIPERDFSTLKCTADLSKDEIRQLEQYSQYKLPVSLWDENKRKPPKYIFYNLNEKKIIVGRGVDAGRDEQNRWGNFLFHNIIIDIAEFCRLKLNPVRIIKGLEEKNIFLEKFTGNEELSKSIELESDKEKIDIDTSLFIAFENSEEAISNLYDYFFNHQKINLPFWISGEKEGVLNFLDSFLMVLPKRKWIELSLNTFWDYNDEKLPGAYFICTLLIDDQSLPNRYFAKLDLNNKMFERSVNMQEYQLSNYGRFYAGMLIKKDYKLIHSLNLLYETAGYSDWKTFIRLFQEFEDDQSKKVLFEYWQNKIITEILKGNIELFRVVRNYLNEINLKKIFASEQFIEELNSTNYPEEVDEFVKYFFDSFTDEERRRSYSNIFKNSQVYEKVRERFIELKSEREIEIFLEIIQAKLSGEYVDEDEIASLLYMFKKSLSNYTSLFVLNKNKILKSLNRIEATNFKVRLVKAIINYKMGEAKELLSMIKDKNNLEQMYNFLSSGLNEIFEKK